MTNAARISQGFEYDGVIETELHGHRLLIEPLLNASSAFTIEQRKEFELEGLLPACKPVRIPGYKWECYWAKLDGDPQSWPNRVVGLEPKRVRPPARSAD